MDKPFIRQVCGALRTNKYVMIPNHLWAPGASNDDPRRCVMGVALSEAGLIRKGANGMLEAIWGAAMWSTLLAPQMDWQFDDVSLAIMAPRSDTGYYGGVNLVTLNNGMDFTFSQLADLIDYFMLEEPCVSGGQIKKGDRHENTGVLVQG